MISQHFNPSIFHSSYLARKRLLQIIQKESKLLTGILLDFGCGTKPYQSLFQVEKYVGLDFENEGHPHHNEQIDFFYDGKTIPFDNTFFDSIFCTEVFEHVFNLEDIISELNRVLKPGGTILATCPFAISEHEVPNDYARYSSYGLKHLFERNGFTVIRQYKTGNAIETITQLKITYIHNNITPFIAKIPVIREVFRKLVYGYYNLKAIILSRLLPINTDLYLNNVILCQKS
jgi:SAM-dependent methyltransferase